MKKQDGALHKAIGERAKYHRTRINVTVEQLAEQIDVTPRYLQDVERGAVGMSLTTLRNLCRALKISADTLIFGEPAGVDALLRGADAAKVEQIEELVMLQLKIMSPTVQS